MKHPAPLLNSLEIKAKKSFGQNFLTTQSSLQGFEDILPNEHPILEIGPGLGSVTEWLIGNGYQVTAIEKDRTLASHLRTSYPELTVIENDVLEVPLESFEHCRFAIGNLPFNITAPCLVRSVTRWKFLQSAIWGLQYEVAKKLATEQGNSLSLLLQYAGSSKFLRRISRRSFYPEPAVDGGWLYWERSCGAVVEMEKVELLLRGLFWGKRKKISTVIKKNPHWKKQDFSREWELKLDGIPGFSQHYGDKRPDTLSVDDIRHFMTVLVE